MIKHITSRAERLHKLLLLSLTSLSLLGLAGCTKSVQSTNLSKAITHVQIKSPSLATTIRTQFKPSLGVYISDYTFTDLSNHDIGYYINHDNVNTTYNSDNDVSSDSASPKSFNADYYAPNEQYLVQKSRKEHKQNYVPLKRSRQTVHYKINNHKKTLTLYSNHHHNHVNWITYKLIHVNSGLNSQHFIFRPIALKRFDQKPIKISKFIGKYNRLTFETASPSYTEPITGRLHSDIKPYKIFHKPTLNNAK